MMAVAANVSPLVGLFGSFGWQEILFILVVILLLFGGAKLPELARGLARGLRSFKEELHGVQSGLEEPPDSGAKQNEQARQGGQPAGKADHDKAQQPQDEKDDARGEA